MGKKTLFKDTSFIAVLLLIGGIIFAFWANYLEWWQIHFRIGPIFLHHWASLTGASFVAVYTPVYYLLKRHRPKSYKILLRLHMFGNLLAVMIISTHFGHHMHRPAEILPDLRSGIALYTSLSLLIATGVLLRFQLLPRLRKYWRPVHLAGMGIFYFAIIIHLLQRLGIL